VAKNRGGKIGTQQPLLVKTHQSLGSWAFIRERRGRGGEDKSVGEKGNKGHLFKEFRMALARGMEVKEFKKPRTL